MRSELPGHTLNRKRGTAVPRSRARRGVTLLEVLFSIGIVAVGLLGVLIIVPLAGTRSAQGTIADGGDRMGRNAIRLFDVQHMRQPNMWTTPSCPPPPVHPSRRKPSIFPISFPR